MAPALPPPPPPPPLPPPPPRRPTRSSQTGTESKSVRNADVERALALRDVMQHAVKVEKEFKKKTVAKRSLAAGITASLICIPLLAFSVYSWVAKPEFIWGASAAPPPAEQEADMRAAIFLLALRLEGARESAGAYPTSLDALEDRVPGVTYALLSDSTFELRAKQDGKDIVFRSDESADVFLGNSFAITQRSR